MTLVDKFTVTGPIRPLKPQDNQAFKSDSIKTQPSTFDQVLQSVAGLKFSKHAEERMKARRIELGKAELEKLNSAVEKARAKGAKESLILMNDLALVVSVRNNTVITAIAGENIKENVFTNIDSAVIV